MFWKKSKLMTDYKNYKSLLISDFTIDNFAGLLTNNTDYPLVDATVAPFSQVMPLLLDDNHEIWKSEFDCAVVWTQPQAIIKSFNKLLQFGIKPIFLIIF